MKYSVLCYIINGYEDVKEIGEKDPDCEYILVTDNKDLRSETWKVVYDESLHDLPSIFDRCYSIRFNLFKYATTSTCIYIDANIQIHKSLKPMIDVFNAGQYDMCMMPHPLNCQFIQEYKNWINWRKYPVANAQKFMNLLQASHYDINYKSLFQGCFKIVRNNKTNSDFDNLSLAFLKYLGADGEIERLDQTVYSFVLNQWFSSKKILPVSEQIVRSEFMTWYWHKSNQKNLNQFMVPGKPDMKWVFNQQVECFQLLDGELKTVGET